MCWCTGKERVLIGIISTFTLCEEVHNIRALAEQIYTATCWPRRFTPCLTGSSFWASTGWPPTFRVVTRKTCRVRVHFLGQCGNVRMYMNQWMMMKYIAFRKTSATWEGFLCWQFWAAGTNFTHLFDAFRASHCNWNLLIYLFIQKGDEFQRAGASAIRSMQ